MGQSCCHHGNSSNKLLSFHKAVISNYLLSWPALTAIKWMLNKVVMTICYAYTLACAG